MKATRTDRMKTAERCVLCGATEDLEDRKSAKTGETRKVCKDVFGCVARWTATHPVPARAPKRKVGEKEIEVRSG